MNKPRHFAAEVGRGGPPRLRQGLRRGEPRRRGIALVVVLGFLSVLVVLAVAFSVSMRVERLAGRNYADVVKCRHLVSVALVRACDDIDSDAANRVYPDWSGRWAGGVFTAITGATVNLASGYASNFVPGYIRGAAESTPARYIDVTGAGVVQGRVAYLALDCSGLIDVNRGYDDENRVFPRQLGSTVNELQLTNALTAEVTRNWENLFLNKSAAIGGNPPYWRMETLPEILALGAYGFGNQQPLDPNVGIVNLFHYSRYPRGYWDGNMVQTNALDISGNEGDLRAKLGDIERIFSEMGVAPAAVKGAALNLLDFVDTDNQPKDVASLCTEAVPMINEVVVYNQLTATGPLGMDYSNSYKIAVEIFYPFGGTTNKSDYTVRVAAQYVGAQPAALNPPAVGGAQGTFRVSAPSGGWTPGTFVVVTNDWVGRVATNATPDMSGAKVQLRATVLEGSDEVDLVGDSRSDIMEIPIGSVIPGPGPIVSLGREVNDPRINWDGRDEAAGGHWKLEAKDVNTLSNYNTWSLSAMMAAGADGTSAMYVANAPLRSVGELGFLLYDPTKPWTTIRLLDPGALPVLDRFTLATNVFQYGLVNLNSRNPMALATVFNQMPYDRYPGEAMAKTVMVAQASALGLAVSGASGSFRNLSDMRVMGGAIDSALPGLDDMIKESVVRNSAGLLGVRQNLYTILLAAQAYSEKLQVVSEQRAVAVVWRDPYPAEDGTHPMFVRYFRWLTE
jgi:hypothetical protein